MELVARHLLHASRADALARQSRNGPHHDRRRGLPVRPIEIFQARQMRQVREDQIGVRAEVEQARQLGHAHPIETRHERRARFGRADQAALRGEALVEEIDELVAIRGRHRGQVGVAAAALRQSGLKSPRFALM